MERLVIQRGIMFLLFLINSLIISAQQYSRLKFEPIYYFSYGFSRFNPETYNTTHEDFSKRNAFGKWETKDGNSGMFGREKDLLSRNQVGLILHYEWKPKLNIDLSIQTSGVGASGAWAYIGSSGGATRVIRYSVSPSYQIAYWKKHNLAIYTGLGIMADVVSKSTQIFSGGSLLGPIDTFRFVSTDRTLNYVGVSLHPNILCKFTLENGNSFNFHLTGAIGFVPLTTTDFIYSKNQDNYYTELWSNGSFFRIGIGYEFQVLKRLFNYSSSKTKYEHEFK